MILVNFVSDDEEILEPYEWEDDDNYEEYPYLVMFHLSLNELYDFLYGTIIIDDLEDGIYIVGDTHFCFVVDIKNKMIDRRGTIYFHQQEKVHHIIETLPITSFHYRVIQRAYEKELGLTRNERLKKQIVEELLEEAYYYHSEVFEHICKELMIEDIQKEKQYEKILLLTEKGYTSIHDILYEELISKK